MRATTDPATALAGTASLVLSVTAQALRRCLTQWKPHIESQTVIVSLM
ncbi:hypothetical protein ACWC6I_34550 [Streptomyces sp. NPDC001414]